MLRKKIQDDQITYLKSGDKEKLSVLRYILAQIKNREIDKKEELNDEETIQVIKKIAKEMKESILAFQKGARPDLVAENEKQLAIISVYIPAEISEEELVAEIDKIISDNKSTFDEKPKAIIGLCIGRLKSKADPSRIMKILQTKLPH